MSVQVCDVVGALELIAPLHLAADWDRVGLLIGEKMGKADSILLTIDLTEPVMAEAVRKKINFIVAYHPPIFAPLDRLTDGTARERMVMEAIRRGMAIYSPHTALDAVPGGVNDWLGKPFGPGIPGSMQALEMEQGDPPQRGKVITFVPSEPPEVAERVRQAMARAGAGVIGAYEACSFTSPGVGTFKGGAGTHPVVGKRGRLERVAEVRLEMVVSDLGKGLAKVIAALRETHPYEEPPFDVYALQSRPRMDTGMGRIIEPDTPLRLDEIIPRLKVHLGVDHLRVAPAKPKTHRYHRIGVCAGAGGSMLNTALAEGCDLFLTGEMRYHDVLEAGTADCTVVLAGHSNTERGYLKVLRRKLKKHLPQSDISISRKDGYPLGLY